MSFAIYLSTDFFAIYLSVDFWTFDFALRFVLSIGHIKQLTGGFCETRNPTFPYPSIGPFGSVAR